MNRIFLIAVGLSTCLHVFCQSIITVNNLTPGYDYMDLQEAINAANDGDIVMVYANAGKYTTNPYIVVDKPLTIIGEGYYHENIESRDHNTKISSINFREGSEGSVISGFEIDEVYVLTTNIHIQKSLVKVLRLRANSVTLSGNVITSTIQGGVLTTGHIVRNNFFNNNNAKPLGDIDDSEIYNNLFLTSLDSNVLPNNKLWNNIRTYFSNNETRVYIDTSSDVIISTIEVTFVGGDSPDGKYQLKDNSPAKGVGVGGVDSGIFGGTTPYIISGTPSIPRITNLTVPQNATPGAPLQVSFTIKGN